MILYLDTSSLVKLYVTEPHAEEVKLWTDAATAVVTSRLALPEATSAFARRHREGDLTEDDFIRARHALEADWARFVVVEIDEHLAADLAARHPLRGADAVHVAAALAVRQLDSPVAVSFSTFDMRQRAAARAEGLTILVP